MIVWLLGYAFSFMVLGLWVALRIINRRLFPKEFLYICSLAVSLVVYYFLFYIYLANTTVAHYLVIGLILLALPAFVSLILSLKKSSAQFKLVRTFYVIPLLLTLLFFSVYTSLLYSCRIYANGVDNRRVVNQTFCAIQNMPLDNGLPQMYADFVLQHKPRALVIDWTIADRPPVQIGTSLPIMDFTQGARQSLRGHYYNVLSIFLKISWVGALWGLFRKLKLERWTQVLLFIGFGATGFFFLNSVFVWPKFLSAGLVLAAMTPYLGEAITKESYRYAPVAIGLICLGMLSHTNVMFTLLPFVAIQLYKLLRTKKWRRQLNLKFLVIAVVLALAFLAPWQVFKSSITTSDRLIKYHFADVTSYADTRGTVQTIIQEYQKLSFHQWLHNKQANVAALFNGNFRFEAGCRPIDLYKTVKGCSDWKTLTFFSTFFALETFTVGFLALVYLGIRKLWDRFDKELLWLLGGSLLFWLLVMFHPGSTVVHQGSYLTMILLFVLLGKSLAKSSRAVLVGLTIIQLIIFYQAWIYGVHHLS